MTVQETKQDEAIKAMMHIGPVLDFYQPSGRLIQIRESTAEDEDLLSQQNSSMNNGNAIIAYIASITLMDSELKRRPTMDDIEKWGVKDKYYTLLMSRIHSLGDSIAFEHSCSNRKCDFITPPKAPWREDLKRFTQDFSKHTPEQGDEGYDKNKSVYAATAYAKGMQRVISLVLTSGKVLRYNVLDSIGEKVLTSANDLTDKRSIALIARNLELKVGEEWASVKTFKMFSSRESVEIWASVEENDKGFIPMADITCPKCGLLEYINLMLTPSFFFPVVI